MKRDVHKIIESRNTVEEAQVLNKSVNYVANRKIKLAEKDLSLLDYLNYQNINKSFEVTTQFPSTTTNKGIYSSNTKDKNQKI